MGFLGMVVHWDGEHCTTNFTQHFPPGYIIVLGFGAMFSVVTTLVTVADKYFGGLNMTSEQFK
jgi:hypothetical protein